ncbi:MAG TPA: NADH-quinone oxidoreductase subunit N [Longilinea sp.]|nr:NADH-quinone oxidoreductase subunit N [Longilinea sp.]
MGFPISLNDLNAVLPFTFLVVWAVVLLLVDLWIPKNYKGITAALSALGIVVAFGLLIWKTTEFPEAVRLTGSASITGFNGTVVLGTFSAVMQALLLVAGLVGIAAAYDYLKRMQIERGEYYPLLLFSLSGMMLMSQALDMIVIFLALELLSLPLYVLSGFARPRLDSEESALKYFFMGTFGSAFFLFGTAMLFGYSGTTLLVNIFSLSTNSDFPQILLFIGCALVLVGLGFKVSLVPFHMWTPDVYQGAPTPVVTFMSVGVKIAGFTALLRVILLVFPMFSSALPAILFGLSALTMIVGNIMAVVQTNMKRMLAYSGIAGAGYLLMALIPYDPLISTSSPDQAFIFYLVAYALSNFAAWSVVIMVEQEDAKGLEIKDYAGLGRKNPWLGLIMLVAMLSLAGVPLTLGFWGKFYLFQYVIDGGYWPLALIGLITSVIAAVYYLRVIMMMFMQPGEPVVRKNFWLILVAALSALAVLGLAFIPGLLQNVLWGWH